MITVFAGIVVITFCLFLFIDAYRIIANPLFEFQSVDIQSATWVQLGIGSFGILCGLVFFIKGFLDYHKQQ